jgi:hypothetical protein
MKAVMIQGVAVTWDNSEELRWLDVVLGDKGVVVSYCDRVGWEGLQGYEPKPTRPAPAAPAKPTGPEPAFAFQGEPVTISAEWFVKGEAA